MSGTTSLAGGAAGRRLTSNGNPSPMSSIRGRVRARIGVPVSIPSPRTVVTAILATAPGTAELAIPTLITRDIPAPATGTLATPTLVMRVPGISLTATASPEATAGRRATPTMATRTVGIPARATGVRASTVRLHTAARVRTIATKTPATHPAVTGTKATVRRTATADGQVTAGKSPTADLQDMASRDTRAQPERSTAGDMTATTVPRTTRA